MTTAYREALARRDRPGALVRGDDGNLHLRQFATPAMAAQAAAARELAPPADVLLVQSEPARVGRLRRETTLKGLARELGVSSRTIRRYLPWLRHRQPAYGRTFIPQEEVVLIKSYGLHGVRRMRTAANMP